VLDVARVARAQMTQSDWRLLLAELAAEAEAEMRSKGGRAEAPNGGSRVHG
jgi:hypothetical protein